MTSDLGALTTTFSAPASCTSAATDLYRIQSGSVYYLQQGPLTTNDCYPSDYKPTRSAYYSPGICPSGYTPACEGTSSAGNVVETTYTCCPTYGLGTTASYQCRSYDTDWPWLSTLVCGSALPATSTTISSYISINSSETVTETATSFRDAGFIQAFGVQVRFQSTTTSSSSSSSSGSITVASTSSLASSSMTPTETGSQANNSTSSSSGGLSAGAAAGIGVACALVGVGVAATAIFLWLRRRKRSKGEHAPAEVSDIPTTPGPGAPQELGNEAKVQEFDAPQSLQPSELLATPAVHELNSAPRQKPVELYAGYEGR